MDKLMQMLNTITSRLAFLPSFLLFLGLLSCNDGNKRPGADGAPGILAEPVLAADLTASIPELAAYQAAVKQILTAGLPVLTLPDSELQDEEQLAQRLALEDPNFTKEVRHTETGEALHNEIMDVRLMQSQEAQRLGVKCDNGQCYWVELYNFFYHNKTVAVVDVWGKQVIRVLYLEAEQPFISKRLKEIALKIAKASPEIKKELGADLEKAKVVFQDSKCERSLHLCVSPVFIVEEKALWTIVDLSDMYLIGYKWALKPGEDPSFALTERSLQNEYIMEFYCGKDNVTKKDDWEITTNLTSSDGLEIKNVKFKGAEVVQSAKIVDWHVSYTYKKDFGYSDAMGCPMFSSAANVAFRGTQVEDIMEKGQVAGFALVMDFRSPVWPLPCNYRYENRYEFYKDGRFRIAGINMGQGCGVTGWYRPVFRIDLAGPEEGKTVEQWNGKNWEERPSEFWHLQNEKTTYTPEGYLFKITGDQGHGYYLVPSRGQFLVDGHGDNAYTYFMLHHPEKDEGKEDTPTFGPCCNTDYRQGPEAFIEPAEGITGKHQVIWYVPQMANNNQPGKQYCWTELTIKDGKQSFEVFPGIAGPMFVPFEKAQ